MRSELLSILCCPRCHSDLQLQDDCTYEQEAIISGTLICLECKISYTIRNGVACMVANCYSTTSSTKQGFEYQWQARLTNKCEHASVCYGYDIKKFMTWLDDTFITYQAANPMEGWFLDAGCGSAEKAVALAVAHPDAQVIAIDLSESLVLSAQRTRNIKNLHFVQADVCNLPFKPQTFNFIMSIGVLHHTADTYSAFENIAKLVKPEGKLLTWIYPQPHEDSFWAGLYRQRDKHFFNLARQLPPWLTMFLCRVYVTIFFPWILSFLKKQYKNNCKRFPIYPDKLSLKQLYQSSIFLSFDNVMPFYQYRHNCDEVVGWYKKSGFTQINANYPGFFMGVAGN
jgi:ubiquinone/menaquinone biosynthesis C-methylase UbiE/uncharacterized protein YbaR (Trm112 family)